MNIIQVEKLAKELMAQHLDDGWKLRFTKSIKVFGRCCCDEKVIELGKIPCQLNEYEHVRNVILYEIAHALVGYEHAHDEVWVAKHKEIGGDGSPCCEHPDVVVKTRYVGICPNNHLFYFFGKPRRRASCIKCEPAHYSDKYRLYVFPHEMTQRIGDT